MRIAIDISQVVYGTGVSVYTNKLVQNLLKIDGENEYVLFAGTLRRKADIVKLFPQARVFPIPPTLADIIWNKIHLLPVEKLIGRVDVVHTSDWTEPPSSAFKVTTIHDLAPILFPNLFPRDIIRSVVGTHKMKLAWTKKESDRIIAPSNATKNDLIKLGFDEGKIRVIPEAPSGIFKRASDEEILKLKSKYKIAGKYLLAVGMDPRKNSERIIKAFDLARAGRDLKLVFVGVQKYLKIEENRNIRIAGQIPLNELPVFYSGAEALVYPSLYEGFGLPILEAFACETPVVTSNLSSMPEVAGDAAVLVDPKDVRSIAEGIEKVLRGPKNYIDKGKKKVEEFSWKKTAEKTLAVYDEFKK